MSGPRTNTRIAYTDDQARRGRDIYLLHCVLCHGTNLSNAQFGAPLKGEYFRSRWSDRTVAELFTVTLITMPPEKPMSLSEQDYADVIAYILQANDLTAGAAELPANISLLTNLKLPW